MDTEEMQDLIKSMQKVAAENQSLQYIKGRYVEIAKELDVERGKIFVALKNIEKLTNTLDPFRKKIRARSKYKNGQIKSALADLATKMMSGTHITRKLIESTYPDLNSYGIINKLRKLPNVQVAREHRRLRLFFHKGVEPKKVEGGGVDGASSDDK